MKVNNNQVILPPTMKFLTHLIKSPLALLTTLGKTHSKGKRSHSLTLRATVKVIAKIKRQCPREQKTCLPKNI